MTVAASATGTGRPWRSRLLVIAFALSLVLNLCFVAGAVWSRLHTPPNPEQQFHAVARELHLTQDQEASFRLFVVYMRTRFQQMHLETQPLLAAAWTEIAKPQPDASQIKNLFDDMAAKRQAFQREATARTLEFLATLSPEQRVKFVERARARRLPWGRPLQQATEQ